MRAIRFAWVPMIFAGALIFGTSFVVRADDDCQKRVIKADHHLHEAIERYGRHSQEADHWRYELAEARSYCYEHHRRWWDEDAHRWHSDRDWDDHDHDH